ncbi:8-amino-7-oxononanoate synthase [Williamsoniiplasma luminosum]|uniref:8-amino-7-oxononanoate synthase n=1 Tax=Williamsoniiplasma luminosum TaxID=214888 RepID=A0A2K8NW80_9MOLU|nr:glycine C-acetyltransferase [Williamsoniiplasma luminosum]ATZ16893.1 8-amino-7-oxononanoate synthase [Williamsoniiplasma luminosum]
MELYKRLKEELDLAKENKVYNNIKTLESKQNDIIKVNGKDFINMCSNNYLGYAADPLTIESFKKSLDKYGAGPGAVRSISGSYDVHDEFERKLAEFKGFEATLVVQSGFQANTGLIPTITNADDLVISDELNHASIIDGVRLSKAARAIYKHMDTEDLERVLKENRSKIKGNIFIITDGVFSMDGDIAPLDKINALAKKYDAYTIVDDAHGEGVIGPKGRGSVAHFGLEGQIDIETGTMSKAFGLVGGFISGKKVLIEYLKQKSRVFLFSSSLPQGFVEAGTAILNELENDDTRLKKLWDNTKYIQSKFIDNGFSIGTTQTPITPFMVGEEVIATELTKILFEQNILVSPIIFPTVPKGKARIRLMISSLHTKAELDKVYDVITKEYKKIIDK